MGDPDSARALRPLRQLTLPGGRTLLRAGLVAVLLGLAAAILHTPTSCPPAAVPSDAPSVADRTPPPQTPPPSRGPEPEGADPLTDGGYDHHGRVLLRAVLPDQRKAG